ncbi:MAG: conjugal transfer protein TraX [Lachnospiraceae bacterium]|nr:conjugal transfer protein TraX [Lachnospiraceae bacterium]
METKKGISGAVLKWIAIITMLTDHIGASIVRYYRGLPGCTQTTKVVYDILRDIGRIAFPIFIFLLIEGYRHTKNRRKYLFRLLLFCIISEIPFNMAFCYKVWDPTHQNVFFTLSLGFIAIWLMDELQKKSSSHISNPAAAATYSSLCNFGVILTFCLIAELLKTDYRSVGVLAICAAWVLKDKRYLQMPVCCLTLLLSSQREWYALIACIPILFYNGTRGKQSKYFFYIFYPLHLLILGCICVFYIVA